MDLKEIKISVRNLIEFVLRSGDLDNRILAAAEKDAMQAGNRIHRKIQKSMGAGYEAEVLLRHSVSEQEFKITIEGRADGIFKRDGIVVIDEIKGIYRDLVFLNEPVPIHMAQAMCYGFIYGEQHQLEEMMLQITYCNLESEEIRRFQEMKSLAELEAWFSGLIHEYIKWARYLYQHGLRRDQSLKALEFPYPYRKGQRELAVAVYQSIARSKNLYIQAPTGIGKTLSVVFPALKAVEQGYGEKLFYLTAKTIARTVAEETFSLLREKGLYFRSVTITAKEKLCFQPEMICNPDVCSLAKGHFDRINDAVYEIIHNEFIITKDVILKYAEQYQVCPFEFCLDISSWVDGIICDYNYVFHPKVRLKRYFSEGNEGKYLFLIDEAHNLVTRAREMYSAALLKEEVLAVKRMLKSYSGKITKNLTKCNQYLLELKRRCETYEILDDIQHIIVGLTSFVSLTEEYLVEHPKFEERDKLLDFYFRVKYFLMIYDEVDSNYEIFTTMKENGEFELRLFCMNPAKLVSRCLEQGKGAVFFSATLLPVNYYKELLTGNKDEYAIYAESPFDQKRRLIAVASDVSSKYTRRNRSEYQKVAEYIRQIIGQKQGNYLVFFPSYKYMEQIRQLLAEDRGFQLMIQQPSMDEQQKEAFLDVFSEAREQSLVALCVMGGSFSEGIDLKGSRLIGAIVIGTGIPMVSLEQELLRNYFEETHRQGYEFSYQYPGMNKVMQSAGRVIRTMEDIGVILLLDDRFLQSQYQRIFPREWNDYTVVNQRTVSVVLQKFWEDASKFVL